MCGIAGFFCPHGFRVEAAESILLDMVHSLVHRGPDDFGTWLDCDAGLALGHRRLSIQDITYAGHQPMVSDSGRFRLVFNGEIYNNIEIRREIQAFGHKNLVWRGHSDTETLLAAIEVWGLESALQRSNGMFALALWDRTEHALSIARDRMGEKPLYYGWQGDTFLFGSELKALRLHPSFNAEIDRDVLPLYLRHGYVPTPYSIWQGIYKLIPGTILRLISPEPGELPQPVPYWSASQIISAGQVDIFSGSDEEAISMLESQLLEVVGGQMVADVPLGAFLSGGIDSSTVVALLQAQSSKPVKTYTIGFSERGYNEAEQAMAIAAYLGTDHTELYVTPDQAQAVIPELSRIYDEPFGDSSAIPTFLVSQLAREDVTVSLSGDGGDELFGGYGRYFDNKSQSIFGAINTLPQPVRLLISQLLRSGLVNTADAAVKSVCHLTRHSTTRSLGARANLIGELASCNSRDEYYQTMINQWHVPPVHRKNASYAIGPPYYSGVPLGLQNSVERMMATDTLSYLPDDILVKVDRAAMAVSLESRVPFLDHRVVELAWRMPYNMKVRNGQQKWILRQVLHRYLPSEFFERPKMGFGVPVGEWLRGPLREWAEDLLNEKRLEQGGFFDPKPIRHRWHEHLRGQNDWSHSLWIVISFQSWLELQ